MAHFSFALKCQLIENQWIDTLNWKTFAILRKKMLKYFEKWKRGCKFANDFAFVDAIRFRRTHKHKFICLFGYTYFPFFTVGWVSFTNCEIDMCISFFSFL